MASARLENRDVGVGVDADLGGDLQSLANDIASWKLGVLDERARRRHGVWTAGSDGENSIIGLDDVASARDDESVLAIGDGEQSFEPSQNAVAAPVFRQLDDGTR